jgi:hypothetical protein
MKKALKILAPVLITIGFTLVSENHFFKSNSDMSYLLGMLCGASVVFSVYVIKEWNMFGRASDVPGDCNAHLVLGDDFGDNDCTFRCQLPVGHEGLHKEVTREGKVIVTWEGDDKVE